MIKANNIMLIVLGLGSISAMIIGVSDNMVQAGCTEEYAQKAPIEKVVALCNERISENSSGYNQLELAQIRLKDENEKLRSIRDTKAKQLNELIQQDEVAFRRAEK